MRNGPSEGPDKNWFSWLYIVYVIVYVQVVVCKISFIKIRYFFVKIYIEILRKS